MLFNGYLTLGYSTVFTILPVFCIIFDVDLDKENVLKYPKLYESLQNGREISIKNFLIWTLISLL